jgi:ParB-like chromosome segregation protein Spo0J
MKKLIRKILREQLNPIKWVKPDYEDEEEEFELTASEIGDDYEETLSSLINGYWNSTIEVLTDEEWSQMENTDSWGLETEEAIYNVIGGYGRSNERILKHSLEPLRNGGVVETPIVVYSDGNPPYLVAGNTRLSACKVLGIVPTVTKVYI